MELNHLFRLIEERLTEHDDNRKETQDQTEERASKIIDEAILLESKINEEIKKSFDSIEERILNYIEILNNEKEWDDKELLIKQILEVLSNIPEYDIQHIEDADNLVNSYKLKISTVKNDFNIEDENEFGDIIIKLHEYLNKLNNSMATAQSKLVEICTKRINEADELNNRINKKLESYFIKEDARLQGFLTIVKEKGGDENIDKEFITNMKLKLIESQRYSLKNDELIVSKVASLKAIDFEERKSMNMTAVFTDKEVFYLSFEFFSDDEIAALESFDSTFNVMIKVWEEGQNEEDANTIAKEYTLGEQPFCFSEPFNPSTAYHMKMRIEHSNDGSSTEWSDTTEFISPDFSECAWKECPDDVDEEYSYSVDTNNNRIAIKNYYGRDCGCTIIGNLSLPLNKVTSWSIKILKSENNDGYGIYIGVAPFDINIIEGSNCDKCGWYFNYYWSALCSGPPHNYDHKEYGPRKKRRGYVHAGDGVGVVMDTTNGELSFVLNGTNLGVAYEGIPLDKPLVPCVLLSEKGTSIKFISASEVKRDKDRSVPIPSNIIVKSVTCGSITLTWDAVERARFYQVEVDGNKLCNASIESVFTKRGFTSETEHSFRVRTVRGNSVSEWSDIVKARTERAPNFSECVWRKCPDYVKKKRVYSLDEGNTRIAKRINSDYGSTIIGNIPLPPNRVTSWNIKMLNLSHEYGNWIYIGVAPFDIDQNEVNKKCGWYINCHCSTLISGPPHNYHRVKYGPRKKDDEYIHTGDIVGVIMDTAKGELSFIINGVSYGVAFDGIPLDKPLVPCVLLKHEGDSVELDLSEAKENVDDLILIPKIKTKGTTWDSIAVTWDKVDGASFYQVEVDGSKYWKSPLTNTFTWLGLLEESGHTFKVRTVKKNSVSEWSDIMKVKTLKIPDFSGCSWKACPDYLYEDRKYIVDEKNPRIATNITDWHCTLIGNTPLPFNKVILWNIKILKSKSNDGKDIFIGIGPFDTDQNEDNYDKSGWYFNCYRATLLSGRPHNYKNKKLIAGGERYGEYVHTGDSVGVVMDTTIGELSFVVNGVSYGVAYEGIPLDKPLVPCVILREEGDSVELDFSEVKENVDSSIPVPSNIRSTSITWDSITLAWDAVVDASFYQIEVDGNKWLGMPTTNIFINKELYEDTEHSFRVRTVKGTLVSEWSDISKVKTLKISRFSECAWKECPYDIDKWHKYSVDENNPKIASMNGGDDDNYRCTIIGNTPLPQNKVTSWNIKILKSKNNNGRDIYIGVAPFDINQDAYNNLESCGWYFDCYKSALCSGPPHDYEDKQYGPKKKNGKYIHIGDFIDIVMDTIKGNLSFIVNNMDLGVAYEWISLDKPLVPCVLLKYDDDTVGINLPENEESVLDSSIPAPSSIIAKSLTWDSITLAWNAIEGTLFYQIEVDGNKPWDASTTNVFTINDLLSESERSFRVRTVKRNNLVSEWSSIVKVKTQKESFRASRWKECPDTVEDERKFFIDKNSTRVATFIGDRYGNNYCSAIGNTFLPTNKIISWGVRIHGSNSPGAKYFIGVAPFDINQNDAFNFKKCGWYFSCYDLMIYSGPPHNYDKKEYGLREKPRQYVHAGDTVDVVMDTVKGELSFVLNEVNYGVAYEGIPLDKPLVPCVLFYGNRGDSVELCLAPEVNGNVDTSIPVPTNIKLMGATWDSITITWDKVDGAEFYQIEVDKNVFLDTSLINVFTKKGVTKSTEHSFRVRTVKGTRVGGWSNIITKPKTK